MHTFFAGCKCILASFVEFGSQSVLRPKTLMSEYATPNWPHKEAAKRASGRIEIESQIIIIS
jgi:hypothetical protein